MNSTLSTAVSSQSVTSRQIARDAPRYPDYKPLDSSLNEVRLLELGPDFKYTLRHASLSNRPQYAALSYYWGAPGVTKPIWLNGHEVQIRNTVRQFLKSLHQQFGSITVWLDVICIDQRNLREQSAQVSMMGNIYSAASCVYAWLGADSASHIPIALKGVESHHQAEAPDLDHSVRNVLEGLKQVFAHPYWTRYVCETSSAYLLMSGRLWVVQECVLNPELILLSSNASASWANLSEYASEASFEDDGYSKFKRLRSDAIPSRTDLVDILSEFSGSHCSDPLDRMYSLRALVHDGYLLQVDYAKTPFDIIVELASAYDQGYIRHLSHRPRNIYGAQYYGREFNDVLHFGKKMYSHFYGMVRKYPSSEGKSGDTDESMAVGPLNAERKALQDQATDWLILPMAVSNSDAVSPHSNCFFFRPLQESSLCESLWASFDEHGQCTWAELAEFSRNEKYWRYPDVDTQLHQVFRHHLWLCRARPAAHMSRRLFAILLGLADFLKDHSAVRDLNERPSYHLLLGELLQSGLAQQPPPEIMQCNCHEVVKDLLPVFEPIKQLEADRQARLREREQRELEQLKQEKKFTSRARKLVRETVHEVGHIIKG